MCGISGIINLNHTVSTQDLIKSTELVSYRGPDDEGYLLWDNDTGATCYKGNNTSAKSAEHHSLNQIPESTSWKVGLGHRRLSIQDLSSAGHQPMLHKETGVSIAFNGEVYNYKEIRVLLEAKGYTFISQSDSEVILKSWVEWGEDCLQHFNGMFSILVLDPRQGGQFYAIRDRFGVKPLYWVKNESYYAFASEIKQLRILPEYHFQLNEQVAYDYLAYGLQDHTSGTFYQGISQLAGGEIMVVDLSDNSSSVKKWYQIPNETWKGTDQEAIAKFKELLTDSIVLRLRSDVPVGSCLSGGLDSSSIVCLMGRVLSEMPNQGIKTVTSCFKEEKFDEWKFAEAVVNKVDTEAHKVFPSFDRLKVEFDKILWHMDEPFGSSSQYSQWCVFNTAAENGLKVMLDGQGADEQLAGYGGSDQPLYAGLMSNLRLSELYKETSAYKESHGNFPKGQFIAAVRQVVPFIDYLLPASLKKSQESNVPDWLNKGVSKSQLSSPKSLHENQVQQLLLTSLPVLLKYEDRNSMAWSVESRVPFMDYRLVEFNMSLPDRLLYKKGTRKFILREAMREILPDAVYQRKDKMGFVTPEEIWLKSEGFDWIKGAVEEGASSLSSILDKDKALKVIDRLKDKDVPFDFSYWRLFCICKWMLSMKNVS